MRSRSYRIRCWARSARSLKRASGLRSAWESSRLGMGRRRDGKTSGVVDVLNERGS